MVNGMAYARENLRRLAEREEHQHAADLAAAANRTVVCTTMRHLGLCVRFHVN